jgi:hypothetical protein
MSLADRPRLEPAGGRGRAFRVDELRERMPAEDVIIMDAYLIDTQLSADKVAVELTAAGYEISVGAVAGYRYRVLGVGKRSR